MTDKAAMIREAEALERQAQQADYDAKTEFPGESWAKRQHKAQAARLRARAAKLREAAK